jgi:soluble lytic murein transglycosylase-like protein
VSRTPVAFNPNWRDWRASRNEFRAIVERESQAFGLPPALVDAVMAVESSYNPAVIGFDGEIGLMQVLPSTARMMGFTGTLEQLAQPEINIHYGTEYLAGAWQRADGDLCTATMKYRAGHGETRFSNLSVDYCMRVRNHLMAQGVVVTGSVPQPTFGAPVSSTGPHARAPSIVRGGGLNLAALNTQLRAMTDRKSLHQ